MERKWMVLAEIKNSFGSNLWGPFDTVDAAVQWAERHLQFDEWSLKPERRPK
jgi:hypothetical protein